MELFAAAQRPLRRAGLALAMIVALGLSIGIGLRLSGALAAPPVATVNACVSRMTGIVRVVSSPSRCTRSETPLSWTTGFDASALEARLVTLEADNLALKQQVTTLTAQVPACLSNVSGDAVFTGCNVQIVNGAGDTLTANGKGNLIVGYNEDADNTRTGSHNVVIGPYHTYSAYAGLVAGSYNEIAGGESSVLGGSMNVARGYGATVLGGNNNTARGQQAVVSGGSNNTASGDYASVSGGESNTASEYESSVSGGRANTASGYYSSVSGGSNNTASGGRSSVTGGQRNIADGDSSAVSGGYGRSVSADDLWVAGNALQPQ